MKDPKVMIERARRRARVRRIDNAKDAWNKMEDDERAEFVARIAAEGRTLGLAPGRWIVDDRFCVIDSCAEGKES